MVPRQANEQSQVDEVYEFIKSLVLPLEEFVLTSPPHLRITKANDTCVVPSKSGRLAAKNKRRAAKPKIRARNMWLKKRGVFADTHEPDTSSLAEF